MKMLDHLNVLEYEWKKIFADTDWSVYNQYLQCFFCYFQKQTWDAIIKSKT